VRFESKISGLILFRFFVQQSVQSGGTKFRYEIYQVMNRMVLKVTNSIYGGENIFVVEMHCDSSRRCKVVWEATSKVGGGGEEGGGAVICSNFSTADFIQVVTKLYLVVAIFLYAKAVECADLISVEPSARCYYVNRVKPAITISSTRFVSGFCILMMWDATNFILIG
jgi:hypothetical protein